MKLYRMKHLPSGLFYCPVRRIRLRRADKTYGPYVKSNLSAKGKIYHHKPSLEYIGPKFYSHLKVECPLPCQQYHGCLDRLEKTVPTDWLIEEVPYGVISH